MLRTKYTIGAAASNGICAAQSGTAATPLLLNGSLTRIKPESGFRDWLADVPRVVTITSAGDDTGITFTITGVSNGKLTTETLAGANGAKAFVTVWDLISSIVPSGNTASTVTVGTTNAVKTPWVPQDISISPFSASVAVSLTGATVSCTVQHTFDNIFDPAATINTFNHASIASSTVSADGNYAFPIAANRLSLTGFTAGSVEFVSTQAGISCS